MGAEECRFFTCKDNACNAPLCPMDKESMKYSAWFPNEEICRLRAANQGVRTQKKIAKKTQSIETCYAWPMLNRSLFVGSAITGITPARLDGDNTAESPAVIDWIKKHPSPRKKTSAEIDLFMSNVHHKRGQSCERTGYKKAVLQTRNDEKVVKV